jgi:hypothetical protein
MTQALTVGTIAERLHEPIHRVQYVIRSRQIEPVQRAGQIRVFDEKAIQRIGREIADMRRPVAESA